MDEIDLTSAFYSYGEYIITAELFQYIGNICLKSLLLRGNKIKTIDGTALETMKYKNCLENLDLAKNDFDIHQILVISLLKLFSNLKRFDISQLEKDQHLKIFHYDYRRSSKNIGNLANRSMVNNSYHRISDFLISLPSSLEYFNGSFIEVRAGHSPNSITFTGITHMKMLDIASTTLEDCNNTIQGLEHVKVLNISHFKCHVLNNTFIGSCLNLQQLIMHSSSLGTGLENDHQGVFLKDLKVYST
ncbi:unnamed protein product [Mytilus edulis]|uniref:Uncharacterized protein n=1 Tax=Mytilus edulis TaxID=6550 RepID=A0A8S3UF82_MYTED|nr:unnamed protein product [Mytilus edulis]